ncbi:MAG TPA: CPBP family intramembrane metalloprotease [Melioribacteraceae bacterium]|nr:CPBP family intramembrane metalloprotease [Melioribacteraceae bacterium]
MLNELEENDNNLKPKMPPFFTGLVSAVLIFFIYQLAGSVIYLLVFGLNSLEIEKFTSFEIIMFRLLTVGGQILFMLFPTLVITKYVYPDISKILRVKKLDIRIGALLFIGFVILTPILQYIMSFQTIIIDYLAKSNKTIYSVKQFLDTLNSNLDAVYNKVMIANNAPEFIAIIIFAALTPAVCEEFLFRGLVQKSFEYKFKPFWAIFLTSFIFSIYHFNPYGLIPLILLSMYFGFAVYIADSILISAILHFANNFFSIFVMNVFNISDINQKEILKNNNMSVDVLIFIILIVLFAVLIKFIVKYVQQKRMEAV